MGRTGGGGGGVEVVGEIARLHGNTYSLRLKPHLLNVTVTKKNKNKHSITEGGGESI